MKRRSSSATTAQLPLFRDSRNPIAERVEDLVARLTLEEKVGQLVHTAPAIPRLGIPAYNYWGEALHGIARNGRATVFPQAIGMAATWAPELIRAIGSAIGDEGRAKYHATLRRYGETGQYQGLTFWSPNVNIFRDPRWGRGQETYGEDPHLSGTLGAAFVRGLQGEDPRYLKAAACAKHFAVHSGPEKDRHRFDARVSMQDLHGTYLPAFKRLVTEAKVESVMGAYNRVFGEPCNASSLLLQDILRGQWGFKGHVVSDCWAIDDLHGGHGVTRDAVESVALAVKRGCDLECGCLFDRLGEAVTQGLISEADVDRALTRVLTARFRLGMFDADAEVPYARTKTAVINSAEHRQLSYEAALRSLVLLKNDGALPIGESVRSIFITGPFATDQVALLGNYYGLSDSLTTVLEGVTARIPEGVRVAYRPGCMATQHNANDQNYAVGEAQGTDLIIACMGLTPLLEGEEGEAIASPELGDRTTLGLPEPQERYLRQLLGTGKKVALVLFGGGPIALGDLVDRLAAILFVWYPGQEGGRAIADALFGIRSPSGKLPVTFPASESQLPPFDDYAMAGRTYRYMTQPPAFPFGFGLSYSRFELTRLRLSAAALRRDEPLTARVTLKNSGPLDAEDVIQVYAAPREPGPADARITLLAYRRVRLAPGRRTTVSLPIDTERLLRYDDAGRPMWPTGQYELIAADSAPIPRSQQLGAAQPLSASLGLV